jgi:hypothetical protein
METDRANDSQQKSPTRKFTVRIAAARFGFYCLSLALKSPSNGRQTKAQHPGEKKMWQNS